MTDEKLKEQPITWERIGDHQDDGFLYRGHECELWMLESSLERACKRLYGSLSRMSDMEKTLLREFRRRFHHYSHQIPDPHHKLRWLALMQHHGTPTRLLDWTYSIYVALYFAMEHATGECCVWKINKRWLNDEGRKLFLAESREALIFDEREEEVEACFKRDVLERPPIGAVVQVNPFHLDERLSIQKGVFLYPCDPRESFTKNLLAMSGSKEASNVVKLKIKNDGKGDRRLALKMLDSMNISRATLFPGLDGFAQSLNVYHPLL